MAGVEKVSEQEIVTAAEDLLSEANGELRRVSARQVRQRSGGSNERVNAIVGRWKEQKREKTPNPSPTEIPDAAVPIAVSQAIAEATEKLCNIGPLVGRLIEEGVRTERQRCDREIAVEQERAMIAIQEKEKDLAAAREESHGYSADLDRLETERSELEAQLEAQRNELSEERKAKACLSEELSKLREKLMETEREQARFSAEATRQTALLEVSERNVTKLEAQLDAAVATHRSDLAESRRAHREELSTCRSDYKDIQAQMRETAAELSEAKATVRQLQEQLDQRAEKYKHADIVTK